MFTLENDEVLKLLMDRVKFWEKEPEVAVLFEKMYNDYLENGVFNGKEYSIKEVVDNDCVNNCTTIYDTDKDFEIILKAFEEGGQDISCLDTDGGYSFVESVSDDKKLILVRY